VSYFIVTSGLGGKMWVESTPGVGSRFIIELPGTRLRGEEEQDASSS
jgi:signal transduction histidine kinase